MRTISTVITTVMLMVGMLAGTPAFTSQAAPTQAGGRFLIELNDSERDPRAAAQALSKQYNLSVSHVFSVVLNGFAAEVPAAAIDGLARNPRVKSVEPDRMVSIVNVPTGIDRVGAENVNSTGAPAGPGQAVAVIDTGVGPHPDLNIAGGYNCTSSTTSAWADDHGHGTHVAGTIGANGSIIGVAPGTPIYGVKVLDAGGSGWWSWVICGIDWVAGSTNGGVPRAYVANMSLGGGHSETSLACSASDMHQSICNAVNKGVRFAVAAGNSGMDADTSVPARYPEVITVSALADSDGCPGGLGSSTGYGGDDTRASFSNFGAAVDVAAPGVNIYSTMPGGGYGTMSGTSMASPHVAGLLALGGYSTTPSSFGDPIAVVTGGDLSCRGASPDAKITSSPSSTSNSASATFAFSTSVANSTFQCKVDSAAWETCGGPGTTGSKTYTGLAEGAHLFTVRATTNGSTYGLPASKSWTIDSQLPTGSITSPVNGSSLNESTTLTATASDAGTGVGSVQFQMRPTGGTWTNVGAADTASPFTAAWDTTVLVNGGYELQAVIKDRASNSFTTAAVGVTLTNAANTVITTMPPAATTSGSVSIPFISTDAAATFECSIDGSTFAACVSPFTTSGLLEGTHIFEVRAVSTAGVDPTPARASWNVDLTAPVGYLTSPSSGSTVTSWVALAAEGTDASGIASIAFQRATTGSTSWSTLFTDTSAPFSVSWSSTSYYGNMDFRVIVTDKAGNQSTSAPVTVMIVNVPNTTITSAAPSWTKNAVVSIGFSANDPAATFECSLNNAEWAACTSPMAVTAPAEGSQGFRVRSTNALGTDATPASSNWTYDVTAPTGAITEPVEGGSLIGTVSVAATASDATAGVSYVQFQRAAAGSTSWFSLGTDSSAPYTLSWNTSTLTSGGYQLRAIVYDRASNTFTTDPVNVTVTSPPNTSITSSPAYVSNVTSPSISFTSTDVNAWFECSLDGSAWASCASPMQMSALSNGSHTFQVRSGNVAGVDPSPSSVTWTVDTVAPTGGITSPAHGSTVSGTVNVDATASDANPISQVTIQRRPVGTTTWSSIGSDASSPYSVSWKIGTLTPGSYELRALINDAAGNQGASDPITVTVAGVPNTTITSAPTGTTASTSASIAFTATDVFATFECNLDNQGWTACTSPMQESGLASGSHSVQVRATNIAGTDSTPAVATWTVDATGPSGSITSPANGATVSGTVTISVSASDTAGVQSVVVQRRLTGATDWITVGTDTSSPYSASWNTADLAGSHELRAVLTDGLGNVSNTATITVQVPTPVTPTPTPTATTTPTPTPTPTQTATPTPTATPSPSPTSTATPTPAPTPTVTVSPSQGRSGTQVTVSGSGFIPGETVRVYWNKVGSTAQIGTATVSANGTFSVVVTVPARQKVGPYKIIARGSVGLVNYSANFQVI